MDWERALRCIRHAIRSTPSPDWWKRVLVVAPFYRGSVPTPGAVFTCDMICEATIDRIVELLKLTNSGNEFFSFIYLLFVLLISQFKKSLIIIFPLAFLVLSVSKIAVGI